MTFEYLCFKVPKKTVKEIILQDHLYIEDRYVILEKISQENKEEKVERGIIVLDLLENHKD